MSPFTRRNILTALPALATVAGAAPFFAAEAVEAQTTDGSARPPASGSASPTTGTLGPARAIPLDSVPATPTANGGERRVMLHGTLATGEHVELHQSMQTPGTPAPPLHVVHHSEMILVREGTMRFDHEVDGKVVSETVGPGGVFYVAYGTKHAASNVGTTPAKYFVVQIGGDVK